MASSDRSFIRPQGIPPAYQAEYFLWKDIQLWTRDYAHALHTVECLERELRHPASAHNPQTVPREPLLTAGPQFRAHILSEAALTWDLILNACSQQMTFGSHTEHGWAPEYRTRLRNAVLAGRLFCAEQTREVNIVIVSIGADAAEEASDDLFTEPANMIVTMEHQVDLQKRHRDVDRFHDQIHQFFQPMKATLITKSQKPGSGIDPHYLELVKKEHLMIGDLLADVRRHIYVIDLCIDRDQREGATVCLNLASILMDEAERAFEFYESHVHHCAHMIGLQVPRCLMDHPDALQQFFRDMTISPPEG